jgi:hypothetical protein
MTLDVLDAQSIERRGWRQWSCATPADTDQILKDAWSCRSAPLVEGECLLIVTQSCDLVHHCFENEPVVEAFRCEPLGIDERPDGNLTAGKNPRTLLVSLEINGEDCWFRIRSNGRLFFPRSLLASLDPDSSILIGEPSIAIIQRWLINRIVRTAFPDAFNDRTKKARQKLEALLKKDGERLLGLYVNLTLWEELPDDQAYGVDLIGLVDEELTFAQRGEIEKLIGAVASAYEHTQGIDHCDFLVMDTSEFTYGLLRTHRLFPLDFMSLNGKPGGELPVL